MASNRLEDVKLQQHVRFSKRFGFFGHLVRLKKTKGRQPYYTPSIQSCTMFFFVSESFPSKGSAIGYFGHFRPFNLLLYRHLQMNCKGTSRSLRTNPLQLRTCLPHRRRGRGWCECTGDFNSPQGYIPQIAQQTMYIYHCISSRDLYWYQCL